VHFSVLQFTGAIYRVDGKREGGAWGNSIGGGGGYRLKCKDSPEYYIGQTGYTFQIRYKEHKSHVALGGLVVSMLATGPNVRGFKPGRGRWILRVIKSAARLPSEGK
jgi:hypothetical protein